MKAFVIIFTLFTAQIAAASFDFANEFGFQGMSSIPENPSKNLAPIPAEKNNELPVMKVLVFPHTLSSDWLHGRPDDASQLEITSDEEFTFDFEDQSIVTKSLRLKKNGNAIDAFLADGSSLKIQKISIKGPAPIKLVRVLNTEKSHSYLGVITVDLDSRGIRAINTVDLETYLRGVVPKESVASWPVDALKAQALAARSYAYYHFLTAPRSRDYHVDDTARFQVYAGISGSDSRTDVAIEQTRGEILTYQDSVIVAYFHAYSGGRTDSALNIFKQNNVPYCVGNSEIFPRQELSDELSPSSRWIVNWSTSAYTSEALMAKFKANSNTRSRFNDFSRTAEVELNETVLQEQFNSVKTLEVTQSATGKTANLDFTEVRSSLGWSNFPGYHFRVSEEADGFVFKGSGWGHHVGLSQWGAFIMAKNYAKTYRDIVLHYYNDVSIKKLPWGSL